jgi:hypothetical protein
MRWTNAKEALKPKTAFGTMMAVRNVIVMGTASLMRWTDAPAVANPKMDSGTTTGARKLIGIRTE